MSDIATQLIRLGTSNPELRPHLKPVIASLSKTSGKLDRPWEKALEALYAELPSILLNALNVKGMLSRPKIEVRPDYCVIRLEFSSGSPRSLRCEVTFEEEKGMLLGTVVMGNFYDKILSVPFPRAGHLALDLAKTIERNRERV
jgi:hypothetical protein